MVGPVTGGQSSSLQVPTKVVWALGGTAVAAVLGMVYLAGDKAGREEQSESDGAGSGPKSQALENAAKVIVAAAPLAAAVPIPGVAAAAALINQAAPAVKAMGMANGAAVQAAKNAGASAMAAAPPPEPDRTESALGKDFEASHADPRSPQAVGDSFASSAGTSPTHAASPSSAGAGAQPKGRAEQKPADVSAATGPHELPQSEKDSLRKLYMEAYEQGHKDGSKVAGQQATGAAQSGNANHVAEGAAKADATKDVGSTDATSEVGAAADPKSGKGATLPIPPSSLPAALPINTDPTQAKGSVTENGELPEAKFIADLETFLPRASVNVKRSLALWKEIRPEVKRGFLAALSTDKRSELESLVTQLGGDQEVPSWDKSTPIDGYHYKRLLEVALIQSAVTKYLPPHAQHLTILSFKDLPGVIAGVRKSPESEQLIRNFLGDGKFASWEQQDSDQRTRTLLESISLACKADYAGTIDYLVKEDRKDAFFKQRLPFLPKMLRSPWTRRKLEREFLAQRAQQKIAVKYFGDRTARRDLVGQGRVKPNTFGVNRDGSSSRHHGSTWGAHWGGIIASSGVLALGALGVSYWWTQTGRGNPGRTRTQVWQPYEVPPEGARYVRTGAL